MVSLVFGLPLLEPSEGEDTFIKELTLSQLSYVTQVENNYPEMWVTFKVT